MVHPRVLAWYKDLEQQQLSVKESDGISDEWSDNDEALEAYYWG